MKQLLTFLLLFIVSAPAFSQTDTFQTHATSNNRTIEKFNGAVESGSGYISKIYSDTAQANTERIRWKNGAIIQTSGGFMWVRFEFRWILINGTLATPCHNDGFIIPVSATWSLSGLIYDVTETKFYKNCKYYETDATQVTLATADPTYGRYDLIVADTTGHITVHTGEAAENPVLLSENPTSELFIAYIFVPGGSLTPGNLVTELIYDENVNGEWAGASTAVGTTFDYPTEPCENSVSTQIPVFFYSSNVEWAKPTGTYDVGAYSYYLKFYLRQNAYPTDNFGIIYTVNFLDENDNIVGSKSISHGEYGYDLALNECQLITIPLYAVNFSSTDIKKVQIECNTIYINDLQIDKVYLVSGEGNVSVSDNSNKWDLGGNNNVKPTSILGSKNNAPVRIATSGITRLIVPANALEVNSDSTFKYLVLGNDTTLYLREEYFVRYIGCLYSYDSTGLDGRKIRVVTDTCTSSAVLTSITDSASYHSITQISDTSITLNRPNGIKDTIVFSISGGGSGGGISIVKETHTSGVTVTISNSTTWMIINPSATLSTLNITMPASPSDGQTVDISFGGTLTSGNVVTSLTITPNTGQAILQNSTPSNVEAGEAIRYRYNSTNTKWYRL